MGGKILYRFERTFYKKLCQQEFRTLHSMTFSNYFWYSLKTFMYTPFNNSESALYGTDNFCCTEQTSPLAVVQLSNTKGSPASCEMNVCILIRVPFVNPAAACGLWASRRISTLKDKSQTKHKYIYENQTTR